MLGKREKVRFCHHIARIAPGSRPPLTLLESKEGKSIDGVEEKPKKHVRVDAATGAAGNTTTPTTNAGSEKRVVTMEPSVRSFAGPSAARRDRSDPVMITDALADVRVK